MCPAIPEVTDSFDGLLRQRWRAYRAALGAVRRRPTRDAIHDFRVATRRLLAAVQLGQGIEPDCAPRWFEARLLPPFLAAGRIRDLQVAVDQLEGLRDRHSCATVPRSGLLRQLPTLKRRLKRRLARLRTPALRKRVRRLREAFDRHSADAVGARRMRRLQRANLARAHRAVRTASASLSQPPSAAEMHALRVAIKQARYMIEAADLTGLAAPRGESSEFAAWQAALGGIADRRALLELLDAMSAEGTQDTADLQRLRRGIHSAQRRQIERLARLRTRRLR